MDAAGVPPSLLTGLRAGAAYDAALGLFILFAGRPVMAGLGHPVTEPFLFLLAATPLLILPVLYWSAAAAGAPRSFRAPVVWARFGGGAFILALTLWYRPPGAAVFVAVALADFAWGAWHAAAWRGRLR